MHDQPTRGSGPSPAEIDDQLRGVVLTHLLDAYPAPFTVEELVAELSSPYSERDQRDDIQRAVRDLSCSGLVHFGPVFVWPTRSAVQAGMLLVG